MILLKSHYDYGSKSLSYSFMMPNGDAGAWKELSMQGISGGYALFHLGSDEPNRRMLFGEGYVENNQLQMRMLFVRVDENGRIQVESEKKWTLDQQSVFGPTGPNVRFNLVAPSERPSRESVSLGQAIMVGSEIHVPYALSANTLFGVNGIRAGPFNIGVFHSTDLGKNWEMEKISDADGRAPVICQSTGFYYYFAFNSGLWFSRKPTAGVAWEKPRMLTETAVGAASGIAAVEGDTVHFCWLDRRHEDWRLSIDSPYVGNYEVAYTQRSDSDSAWRKEILLSKGLRFSRSPAISVEGKNVVIVWEGAQSDEMWQAYDIYFATSKDGGKTWAKPLKLTDASKDGISSAQPQVILKNGVIRLFYAQGKRERGVQFRDQASWPVCYQRRVFPN